MKWLRSPTAMITHLVFLSAIPLLAYAVLIDTQESADDYPLALVICCVAYPLVLFLIWIKWRIDGMSA